MTMQLSVNNENISNRFDSNELRELTRSELTEVSGGLECYQFSYGSNPTRYKGFRGVILFQRFSTGQYRTVGVIDPFDVGGSNFNFRNFCRSRGYPVFR